MLVHPGNFDKVKSIDPWRCYICDPSQCGGNLKLRPDWRVKIQDFFINNTGMEFVGSTHTFTPRTAFLNYKNTLVKTAFAPPAESRNPTESTPPSLLISADPSGCSRSLTALRQVSSRLQPRRRIPQSLHPQP